jgi:hypothetical protein
VNEMKRITLLLGMLTSLTVVPLQAHQIANPVPDVAGRQQVALTQEGVLGNVNHSTGYITVSGKVYRFDAKALVFSDRRKSAGNEDTTSKFGLAKAQPGARVTVRGETRDGVLRATHLIIHD